MECKERDSDEWKQAGQVKQLTGTISKLAEGISYYVRVKAINENGLGEARELFQAVVAKDEIEPAKIDTNGLAKLIFYGKKGTDLKAKVSVSGKPTPDTTWYKNGQEIKQTSRVHINDDENSTTLTLKGISFIPNI